LAKGGQVMNFDTKHLVRWGIPGWIMVMVLVPYFYFSFEELQKISSSVNFVVVGALLTVTGVPLGYLLNQIHHSLFWVLPRRMFLSRIEYFMKKGSWNQYFIDEINMDDLFFFNDIGNKKKERYQYLLSRKHELGGVTVSLGISALIILFVNFIIRIHVVWSWIYFVVVFLLCLIIWNSRNYTSSNIQTYYEHYLIESNEHRDNPPDRNENP
jgi:hypothetical protein